MNLKKLEDYEYELTLNEDPMPDEKIVAILNKMKTIDNKHSIEGKTSGNYYFPVQREHISFIENISKDFMYTNPLHFAETTGALQIESELISFIKNMFNGSEESVGSCTSGGTESIFLAVHGLRTMSRERGITNPRIISNTSAHTALFKACHYLNIEMDLIPNDGLTGNSNFNEMISKITENTIGFYLSGINYPHGQIDEIQRINNFLLGKETNDSPVDKQIKNKYSHINIIVDSCLGGFFTSMSAHLKDNRFPVIDFRCEKVSVITCDPHKYGLGPKGCSVVMYKDLDTKIASMFIYPNWSGGLYGTPGITGSRPSNSFVGSWASLKRLGMKGLQLNYKNIINTVDIIKQGIDEIDELQYVGNPLGCAIAFNFKNKFKKKYNIIVLNEILKSDYNWNLSLSNHPNCIRISITLNNFTNIQNDLITNLKAAIVKYQENYNEYKDKKFSNNVLYGTVVKLPDTLSHKIVGSLLSFLNVLEK